MNFKGEEGRYLGLDGTDDGYLYDLLAESARIGRVTIVCHTENIEVVNRIRRRVQAEGGDTLRDWARCKPPFTEAESCVRAMYFAERLARVSTFPIYRRGSHSMKCANGASAMVTSMWKRARTTLRIPRIRTSAGWARRIPLFIPRMIATRSGRVSPMGPSTSWHPTTFRASVRPRRRTYGSRHKAFPHCDDSARIARRGFSQGEADVAADCAATNVGTRPHLRPRDPRRAPSPSATTPI